VHPAKSRPSKLFRSPKRSSMSAPPDSPTSSPLRRGVPSINTFSPKLPVFATHFQETHFNVPPFVKVEVGNDSFAVQKELIGEEADVESGGEDLDDDPSFVKEIEQINEVVSRHLERVEPDNNSARPIQSVSRRPRFSLIFLLTAFFAVLIPYMKESREIGYCEAGTSSNPALREKAAIQEQKERCTRIYAELKANNESTEAHILTCQPLSPIPWPSPVTCTPCPAHATCTMDAVICNESFALQQQPLDIMLGKFLDGLPYFGPKVFPPSCVVDAKGLKKIQASGKRLVEYLKRLRGRKICAGHVHEPESLVGKAKAYGNEVSVVRDALQQEYVDMYRRKHVSCGHEHQFISQRASINRVNNLNPLMENLLSLLGTLIMPSNVSESLIW
jgi:Man1-Src1p-C-terminal domain